MKPTHLLLAITIPLGGCTTFDQFTPQTVAGIEPAASITAGGFHTCAVLRNGNRACWGANDAGQLGAETPELSSSSPVFVPIGADLLEMSAGGRHTCGILEDGSPMCWGDNRDGQLGFPSDCAGTFSCTGAPQIVTRVGPVSAIAAGGPRADEPGVSEPRGFSCAINGDGAAVCWGRNPSMLISRTQVLDTTPRVVLDGDDFPVRGLVSISAGEHHACAVDQEGGVWCWGAGAVASRRADLPKVVDVAAGSAHTCAVTGAGEVICWGENLNGQSGPTGEPCFESCLVQNNRVEGVSDAIAVTAGQRHSCALTGAGKVLCWGTNQNGQLGVNRGGLDLEPQRVAIKGQVTAIDAGDAHTCALLLDGELQCWGSDSAGQLGVGR